jgi:hypothetical protein
VDVPRVLTQQPSTILEEEPVQRRQFVAAVLAAVTIALATAACTASLPDQPITAGTPSAPAPSSTPSAARFVVPTPVPGEVARVDYTQLAGVVSSRTESPPQAAVAYVVTAACRATGDVKLAYVVHQGNIVVTSGRVPCGPDTVRNSVADLQPGPAADITLTGDLAAVSAAFATIGPSM